jgi:long-chain acyl-CoA synthetase
MFVDFLIDRFAEKPDDPAVISPYGRCTYGELAGLCRHWGGELASEGIAPGTVVGLAGDFSPNAIALFLALLERGAIAAPRRHSSRLDDGRNRIAQLEAIFRVGENDEVCFERTAAKASHELYVELRRRGHPGLLLFSSGTSGEPKAGLHDATHLIERFRTPRRAYATLTFLLFDHAGGINTMLLALSSGGAIVSTDDRSPDAVCALIERERIELLPTTPTFLNLLLLSGAHRRHDLSSLRVIGYGAEPMPQATLDRLRTAFPEIKLQQTYGSLEIWGPRAQAREDGSLWVKVGGEGYETRVVDSVLQIRTDTTIMGYLNAPTPITSDGWYVTGDMVLQDGEYLRFLGRDSDLINVGGEKVYPTEVEGVIESMDDVVEATAYGEPNGLLGQIVCARVTVRESNDRDELARQVRRVCRERLERFKVPVKVEVIDGRPPGERIKKARDHLVEARLQRLIESGP